MHTHDSSQGGSITNNNLESMLLCLAPTEVILVGELSPQTQRMLDFFTMSNSAHRGKAHVERVPYSSVHGQSVAIVTQTMAELSSKSDSSSDHDSTNSINEILQLPDLVISGLAACIRYLEQFKLQSIVQLGRIRSFENTTRMTLTPNTLRQLEILQNSVDNSTKGSLFQLMNATSTAFGARLMREWITSPLRDVTSIQERQDAVTAILKAWESADGKADNLYQTLIRALSQVPDVEKGLMRIFHKTATPNEFVTVLEAILKTGRQLAVLGTSEGGKDVRDAPLLSLLLSHASSSELLQTVMTELCALNVEAAKKSDKVNLLKDSPRFPELGRLRTEVASSEDNMTEILRQIRRDMKDHSLKYVTVSQTEYLIELDTHRTPPKTWLKISSTKKVNRYHPAEVREGLKELEVSRAKLEIACGVAWSDFLDSFRTRVPGLFKSAVNALASLDCLKALAKLATHPVCVMPALPCCSSHWYLLLMTCVSQDYTRPVIVDSKRHMRLEVVKGRHPVLETVVDTFVPNNISLDSERKRCIICTGPNMCATATHCATWCCLESLF
eukprot:scaffold1554_cov401-Prasinococcus_capsulatus_cf.AAC.33